jgi:hypothetical protein
MATRQPGSGSATHPALIVLGLVFAALVAATLPIVVGLGFVVCVAIGRPVLTPVRSRRPSPDRVPGVDPLRMTRANLAAGAGLVLIGAVQGLAVVTLGWSITSRGGLADRTAFALAAELLLAAAVIGYVRHGGSRRVP